MMVVQKCNLDGNLFLIKNLLQLRETISFYDAKLLRSTRTVKLSDIFQALRDVLAKPLQLSTYGNLALPFVATQQDDIRQTLDLKLKTACEEFIRETTINASQPIVAFLEKAKLKSRPTLFKEDFASKGNYL